MSAEMTETKQGEPTELGSTGHTQDRAQSGPDRPERSSAEAAAPPPIAHSLPDLGSGDAAAPLSALDEDSEFYIEADREAVAIADRDEAAINDLLSLHKALRKLQTVRSRIEENEATAKRERELLDEWLHTATEKDRRDAACWEGQITAYALRRRQETNGRDKSLTGPHGRVETRSLPPVFRRNDEVLLAWARTHGFIRVQPAAEYVDWDALRKRLKPTIAGLVLLDDGQEVPGVTHVLRDPSCEITTWE